MMTDALFVAALRTAAVLLGTFAFDRVLGRRLGGASRHALWTAGVVAALAAPLLPAILPTLPLPVLAPAAAAGAETSGLERVAARSWNPWDTALLVWAAVASLRLGRMLRDAWRLRRIIARSSPLSDGHWYLLLEEAKTAAGVRRPIDLRFDGSESTPIVFGIRRPRILLPRRALAWRPEEARLVLLHELAHVRRFDCLWQNLARLLAALHWFNPLAAYAAHRLRHDRELACDHAVVAGGARPSAYASTLLKLSRSLDGPGALTAGAPFAEARLLERRLLGILADRPDSGAARPTTAAGLLAIVALIVSLAEPIRRPAEPFVRTAADRPPTMAAIAEESRVDVNESEAGPVTVPPPEATVGETTLAETAILPVTHRPAPVRPAPSVVEEAPRKGRAVRVRRVGVWVGSLQIGTPSTAIRGLDPEGIVKSLITAPPAPSAGEPPPDSGRDARRI